VTGKLQSEQDVIHIVAERMQDLTPMLGLLSEAGQTISALAHADEAHRTEPTETRKRQGNRFAQPPRLDNPSPPLRPPTKTVDVVEAMPSGRNFR
jgi:error-prone DNA polymerase